MLSRSLVLGLLLCLGTFSARGEATNTYNGKPIPPGLLLAPLPPAPAPAGQTNAPPSSTNGPARPSTNAPARPPHPAPAVPEPPPAVVLAPVPAPGPDMRKPSILDEYDMPLWLAETYDFLHGRLRIGLRYREVTLNDDSRELEDSYLGSITDMEALDDYDFLTYFTFEWLVNPYVGIRFNQEQVRAETRTTSYDNHTDGDIDISGPALSLILRYPNPTRFTPAAGIGYAWLASEFEHNPVWYNGFGGPNKEADYDAWVAAGSPPWPNNGYRREIELDDTTALLLIGEIEFRITEHLDFNVFIQHMEVEEVDAVYTLSFGGNPFETTTAQFPMSNTSYGAGLRWTF